ncbi:DUF642 domain-containing protein [Hahella ganghwensis]|uniref:DUF642 domain-containing protein n=1 Tax=Hahella ganghwensis TaxID=286420 RepID=UPI000360D116|nr:DUF642 domain-containing protein [Hahella ganghwensis]
MKSIISGMFLALSVAGSAQANLILNGDFEDTQLSGNSWTVFDSIPGWQTTMGHSIEVQRNTIVSAQSGDQYVELDSYANSAMTQSLNLKAGTRYELSFYYMPRTDNDNNDNGIGVYWDVFNGDFASFDPMNEIISIDNMQRRDMANWTEYTLMLEAPSELMALSFAGLGNSNSVGGFIDNVSLQAVPEPAALAAFGMGLAGFLGVRQFKRSK